MAASASAAVAASLRTGALDFRSDAAATATVFKIEEVACNTVSDAADAAADAADAAADAADAAAEAAVSAARSEAAVTMD